MPTLVDNFTPQKAIEAMQRRFQAIEPGEGANARYNVHDDFVGPSKAQALGLPLLCPFLGSWTDDPESTLGEQRYNWALVWVAYLASDTSWIRAAHATVADVLGAIWSDESLDESGTHFAHGTEVVFDPPDAPGEIGAIYFQFTIVFDLLRGAAP